MAKTINVDRSSLDPDKSFTNFPEKCLPDLLTQYVKSVSKTRGLYKNHAFASAFHFLGVCSGQSVSLEIKNGQVEKSSQFLMVVGPTAVNKSANISVFSEAIKDADSEHYDRFENLKKARSILQDKLTTNLKSVNSSSDLSKLIERSRVETLEHLKQYDNITDFTEEDLVHLGEDPNRMRPVNYVQTIIDDATPEEMIIRHKMQPRGISYVVDEIVGLFERFDRYNKSNEAQKLMEMHSYRPVVVNRKGSDPIRINDTCLNIIGSIQPEVIEKFAKSKSNIKSGFLGRFDFVCTPKEYKRPNWIDEDTDPELSESYYKACKRLLSIEYVEEDGPVILTFNENAREEVFQELNKRNKEWDKITDENKSALLGKFSTKLFRYITTLHLIKYAYSSKDSSKDIFPNKVGIQTVKDGFKIMDFYEKQTKYLFDLIFDDDPLKSVSDKYQQLYDQVPNRFKPSEVLKIAESLGIKQRTLYDHLNKSINLYQKRGSKYIKILDDSGDNN